ncbi:Abi family protein [Subtercola endophyticus]|uniref:Abi family protein n=1 Tax=Subtercola endophyticus TaxID=2895559 RepID=UPI001E38EA47|nr:Abi family protein [Subtercola endophyticus]UFS57597.1 Abi family protein [Subtercola endophyticus]
MTSSYAKPFKSVTEQVALMRARGMVIVDDKWAEDLLQKVGYYRLSGYSYPFRKFDESAPADPPKRLSEFESGTNLTTVADIYEFDRQLRIRLFDAIEMFEIAFRFKVGHLLGKIGAFAHRDPTNFDADFTKPRSSAMNAPDETTVSFTESHYEEWLRDLNKQENRSQEAFVAHFRSKYGEELPVWAATEVMSFGTVIRLYDGLMQRDRRTIAAQFDVLDHVPDGDIATFSSWLNHIRYIRNTCAHHSRLWNRNFDVIIAESPAIEELAHLRADELRRHLYGTLSILGFLLARTHPKSDWRLHTALFIKSWAGRIDQPLSVMGFPSHWDRERLWQLSYSRDEERANRLELLASVDTVGTSEARDLLSSLPTKDRRSRLGYYRQKHAIFALSPTETLHFPRFQFDAETGDAKSIVLEANRRLYVGNRDVNEDEAFPWIALTWWLTKQPELEDRSPLELLEAGKLSDQHLDLSLPFSSE